MSTANQAFRLGCYLDGLAKSTNSHGRDFQGAPIKPRMMKYSGCLCNVKVQILGEAATFTGLETH